MLFEYDPDKSASNKSKHGIDFNAAQALWDDEQRIEITGLSTDEPRILVTGKIGSKHWTAIYTLRGGNIRIISVRRSRLEEVKLYEGQ